MRKINVWLTNCSAKMVVMHETMAARLNEKKGDIAIGTLAGVIMAVVALVLVMQAFKNVMPDLFKTIFNNLKTQINSLWTKAITPDIT